MRTLKTILIGSIILLMASCSTTAKFPVSNKVPAAVITVKKKTDRHNNYTIEITARNLASAYRLNPPKKNYSVWGVTYNNNVRNLGQLKVTNAKKSILRTMTPFEMKEIFITAEDQGNLKYPGAYEISRTSFKGKNKGKQTK